MADSTGKTDIYKIGCIATYLFIWLDFVKNCKGKMGEKNTGELEFNQGGQTASGESTSDKISDHEVKEIYDHKFFNLLKQGKYGDMVDFIQEETHESFMQLQSKTNSPGSAVSSFNKQ